MGCISDSLVVGPGVAVGAIAVELPVIDLAFDLPARLRVEFDHVTERVPGGGDRVLQRPDDQPVEGASIACSSVLKWFVMVQIVSPS